MYMRSHLWVEQIFNILIRRDYFTRNFICFLIGSMRTDRKQRRLAEKGNPKYIFTIPRAILPKPSLCDKLTVTKSL